MCHIQIKTECTQIFKHPTINHKFNKRPAPISSRYPRPNSAHLGPLKSSVPSEPITPIPQTLNIRTIHTFLSPCSTFRYSVHIYHVYHRRARASKEKKARAQEDNYGFGGPRSHMGQSSHRKALQMSLTDAPRARAAQRHNLLAPLASSASRLK